MFLGVVLMFVGAGIGAMIYFSICPPGANCGTANPGLNLAVAAANFFAGVALLVVGVIRGRGTRGGPRP